MSTNFWKFYCWMVTVIGIPLAFAEVANIDKWRLVDYLYVPSLAISFLTIYSYAYKVKIFSQTIWKVIWFYNITWIVITLFFSSPPLDKYYPEILKGYYFYEPQFQTD